MVQYALHKFVLERYFIDLMLHYLRIILIKALRTLPKSTGVARGISEEWDNRDLPDDNAANVDRNSEVNP